MSVDCIIMILEIGYICWKDKVEVTRKSTIAYGVRDSD